MAKLSQDRTPLHEALVEHNSQRIAHFDVPGHKGGRGNKELKHFLGETALRLDVNSMKPLDNLCHPVSVIKEAQELAAEAFGANEAFFIVNGTTAAVQAMVMSTCKAGDKIIMPRNVHRSAINALVVCGALPVYINPGTNKQLGIPLGMSIHDVEEAIRQNPDAKAVLVNNPTYYGICSNLEKIVEIAHANNMLVLVDEAHGTHFYFGEDMPVSAMAAGADMAAVSMHKTGGSLTQSSILLCAKSMNADYVRQVINLTQTTSGSYLLMSSLDIARKNLSLNGKEMFRKTVEFAEYARAEINKLGGYYAYGTELVDGDAVYAFDRTKLSVYTRDIGLAGIEVYDLLRDEYDIQIEFGDIGNILAIVSSGDRALEIERLISALSEIKRLYEKDKAGMFDHEYINPEVIMAPQKAFYGNKKSVPIEQSGGKVCGEFVMAYPPGIPILAPGELITDEILNYIAYAKEKGCFMTGTQDMKIENINIVVEDGYEAV
jgi:lysine decarboxylase